MFKIKLVTELPLFLTLFFSSLNYFSCVNNAQTLTCNRSVRNSDIPKSYAYSPQDLHYLTFLEKRLYFIIKDYIAKLDSEPEYFFTRYIADYEESSLLAFNEWKMTQEKGIFEVHSNPLWSYRMIKRFVTDLPKIKNFLDSNANAAEVMKTFQKTIPTSFTWPTDKDLNNSMDSLLNIQFVYDSNLTEFANGIIGNVATSASLSAIHCFDISKYALKNNEQFTLALEWLEIADSKRIAANRHPILDHVDASSISLLLKEIIKEHDSVWIEQGGANVYQYIHKMSSKYKWIPFKTILQQKYKSKGDSALNISVNDVVAFSALCKGDNLQSEKEKSGLYCWYESKVNSYWFINPQKMELHSKEPYIFQVHDFIGDDVMEYMKREAIPTLERSIVFTSKKDPKLPQDAHQKLDKKYSDGRTSMFSWLRENKHKPTLPSLSQRISYLIGLIASWEKTHTSSSFQIAAYTTGGYFSVHEDAIKAETDKNGWGEIGNRLATFMIYLNDVQVGGRTAFTSAGVAVTPIKGSAVFWYNLKRNGHIDHRTWHGGCPVLLGEKWVANKWIHNDFNMFKRQCTLNKND